MWYCVTVVLWYGGLLVTTNFCSLSSELVSNNCWKQLRHTIGQAFSRKNWAMKYDLWVEGGTKGGSAELGRFEQR